MKKNIFHNITLRIVSLAMVLGFSVANVCAEEQWVELTDDGSSYKSLGQESVNVRYTRTFANVGQYYSFYVPFSMGYNSWANFGKMYKIQNVREYDLENDGKVDYWTISIVETYNVKANTPYIFRPHEGFRFPFTVNFEAPGSSLESCEKEGRVWCANTEHRFDFIGNYTQGFEFKKSFYFTVDKRGLLKYMSPQSPDMTLNPYRWYMVITDRETGEPISQDEFMSYVNDTKGITLAEQMSFRFFCEDEDELPTSIITDAISVEDTEGTAHDLIGRKVSQPKKGELYIVNGRKVMY